MILSYKSIYKVTIPVLFFGSLFFMAPYAHAEDHCASFLCMAGKAQGNVSAGCHVSEENFYIIRVYTASGFNPHLTARARKTYLSTCPGVDINKTILDLIIEKFGYDYD